MANEVKTKIDFGLEGRRSYETSTNRAIAWELFRQSQPKVAVTVEDELDFKRGWNDTAADESGGDEITINLSQFAAHFQTAADVSRRYKLSLTTVRTACREGRIRSFKIGRDYIVFVPDADVMWGNREE